MNNTEAIRFSNGDWIVSAAQHLTSIQAKIVADGDLSIEDQLSLSGMVAEAAIRFQAANIRAEVILSKITGGRQITCGDVKDVRNKLLSILQSEYNRTCLSSSVWESRNLKHSEARAFFNKLESSCKAAGLVAKIIPAECSSVVQISSSSSALDPRKLLTALVASKGCYNVGV